MRSHRSFWLRTALVGSLAITCLAFAAAADKASKPNILVVFGDDIGWFKVSSYGGDLMGAPTPNTGGIGREGLRLSSLYAQPSCAAGRAAFTTGQLPVRPGLTTVGTPNGPHQKNRENLC